MKCKYCDIGTGPRNYDGDLVCNGCGAEWYAAKIEADSCEGCGCKMEDCAQYWKDQKKCCPDCKCNRK